MIAWTTRGKEKQVILAGGGVGGVGEQLLKTWNSMELEIRLEIRFCRAWQEIKLQASGIIPYGAPFKSLISESII